MTAQPWTQTHSGRAWPLLNPTAADVDWRDMATALSRICRFNGHAKGFYSVAQHSMLVARVVDNAIHRDQGRLLLLAAVSEPRQVEALLARAHHDDAMAERLVLAALLHDGHEAYIGDIVSPVAEALAGLAGHDHIGDLKARTDAAIFAAAGLPFPLPAAHAAAVRAADMILLATEKRDLLADGPEWHGTLPAPAVFAITPQAEHLAADTFYAALTSLLGRGESHD